jgi:hypothetical protein
LFGHRLSAFRRNVVQPDPAVLEPDPFTLKNVSKTKPLDKVKRVKIWAKIFSPFLSLKYFGR